MTTIPGRMITSGGHIGFMVTVSDADMLFWVKFGDEDFSYASYREATEAIDDYLARASAKEKLALSCIDRDGTPVVITGIKAGTGELTHSPTSDDTLSLYPDTPAVRALVAEYRALVAEYRALGARREALAKAMLEVRFSPRGWEGQWDKYGKTFDLPFAYAQLREHYAAQLAKAQNITVEP